MHFDRQHVLQRIIKTLDGKYVADASADIYLILLDIKIHVCCPHASSFRYYDYSHMQQSVIICGNSILPFFTYFNPTFSKGFPHPGPDVPYVDTL